MESLVKLWTRLETALAALLIGLSLIHAGQTMGGMLTTSLSTDEFGTIGTFSSKGPGRVVTDYRAPKNHIFFNLANSVLPGRESLNPSRARALSVLAVIFTAGAIICYATYRRQLMEGAVLLALWSTAPNALSLSMEARGYGFIGLFAILGAIATIEFFRSRRAAWLWVLAISTVLGVYTIPGYLFFGGPLMFLVWAFDRSRRTFVFGAGAAFAMLLLYSPVLLQLFAAFGESQKAAENDFLALHGVLRALKLYLLRCDDWEGWIFLAIMALAPFALPASDPAGRAGCRIVTCASIAVFAILLILKSPPIRVSAFAVLPFALAGFLSIGGWLRALPTGVRVLPFAALSIWLIVIVTKSILWSRFTPNEDWLLAGRAIDTAFPARTKVEYQRFAKYLKHTLPGAKDRSAELDAEAFASGSLIVADAGNKWAEGRRFSPPENADRFVEWTVPGMIRDVVLSFSLPDDWSIDTDRAPIADANFSTGAPIAPGNDIRFSTTIPPNAKALVLLLNRPVVHRDLLVQMTTGEEKRNLTDDVLLAGNGIVLPARELGNTTVDIRLATIQPNLELREVWIAQ